MKILRWIQNNAITFSATLILTLVVCNTGFILYNNYILEKNTAMKAQTEQIRRINADLWNEIVRNMDIGMRGYAITQDTALLSPYRSSITKKDRMFQDLATLLQEQHYQAITGLDSLKSEVNAYQQVCAALIKLVDNHDLEAVSQEVKKDRGKQLWNVYAGFTTRLYAYEDQLNQQAEAAYKTATQRIVYLQLLLLLIGAPSLLFIIGRIWQDQKEKRTLFLNVESNNRTYLFDPGTAMEVINEQQLIDTSIANFRKAAGFIQHLSQGNYQVEWEGLNAANQPHNQTNLAGELVRMRERMKHLKQEDERRLWATEGIGQFSEIIRNHQHHLQNLSDQIVTFLTKYLQAQQGSLFLFREEEEEQYLELTACYAFDRKKHLTKRVAIGQGLVGQTYLERSPILLTELPSGYTSITSGLGDATPGCLLVVPMKYNEKVEAVIEIASFHRLEAYQVDWLEKVGEITASTLVSVKTAEKTKALLEESQQQAEEMKAQEEEMRQNMEELEATQEEMHRKEKAHLDEIQRLNQLYETNTIQIQKKAVEMTGILTAVDMTLATIELDMQGAILTANERFLEVMGYSPAELLGQHHRLFLDEAYAGSADYDTFWKELRMGKPQIGEVKRIAKGGREIWLSASYTPVLDEQGQPIKIIKFAQDITAQKYTSLDYQSQLAAISKSNAVIEFDLEGHILAANETFLSLMNYSWEAIRGQHHRLFISQQEQTDPEYAAFWEKLQRGEFVSGEFKRISKEGKEVWIKGSYNAILDPNGKPYKVVKYAQDITAQKQLELESLQQTEELQAQEEEIRQNLEEMQATQEETERKSLELEAHLTAINSTLATIEFTLDGQILKANANFLRLMGYQTSELVHQPHRILVDEVYGQSQEYVEFWQELRAGKPQIGKVMRLTKEGREVWLNASYTPVFDRQHQPVKVIKLAQIVEA